MFSSKENKSPNSVVESPASNTFFRPVIQRKLSINQPNDIYEQEADATAEKVMRTPDPSGDNNLFFKSSISSVQRKCAHCEEEEKQMQRKESNNNETVATEQAETYINSLNGKGRSLDPDERNFFEPRFGHDFSNVQLHTGSEANQSAKSINALAYTHGNNIVFGSGQYQPNSDGGKRLLAHELTHVVQQGEIKSQNFSLSLQTHIGQRMIQKSPIVTHYGTFKDTSYSKVGAIGVDMTLEFEPNNIVNAKKIGLTQAVTSILEGINAPISPTAAARMTSDGVYIDRLKERNNPIYGAASLNAGDTLDKTLVGGAGSNYQLGWNYVDAAGAPQKQSASLHDRPTLSGPGNNVRQVFETAALALEGSQQGTYYGSVRWGYETDGTGKLTQVPLGIVSMGTPSKGFLQAAGKWNSATALGTIKTAADPTNIYDASFAVAFTVPKDTEVTLGQNVFTHGNAWYNDVTIVADGRGGMIKATDMKDMGTGAATADLPVENIFVVKPPAGVILNDGLPGPWLTDTIPQDTRVRITDGSHVMGPFLTGDQFAGKAYVEIADNNLITNFLKQSAFPNIVTDNIGKGGWVNFSDLARE